MNILEHIYESLEIMCWIKMLKFFDADADQDPGLCLTLDPGWKKLRSRIQNKHPGSATLNMRRFI